MAPAFSKAEYDDRLRRVRDVMRDRGLDAVIIGDPSNINWLCGYDAWSFYTPQMMLVDLDHGPFWMGREMDAGAARFTTYLTADQIIPYPETLVQRPIRIRRYFWLTGWQRLVLPMQKLAMKAMFIIYRRVRLPVCRTGCQRRFGLMLICWSIGFGLSKVMPKLPLCARRRALPKSQCKPHGTGARPGVRQCDLMADVIAAQIRGTPEFGGDQTAIHPLILAGEAASTAHPLWNDNVLEDGQTVAFELGGCRKRYNVGLARTVHLGTPSQQLQETAKAVEEGMNAVMAALRADVFAGDVHAAWQKVLDRYGLEKKSRIGYSIGAAYAPDWGEHTLSFRPDEKVPVPENAVVHIILGMWMDGWGMELSETLHVTKTGCDKLADFPQHVHLVQ